VRTQQARGNVVVVRFADDVVVGFEDEDDAMRFRAELGERLRKFSLDLHANKTRLIEFGRFAAERRARKGQGKPRDVQFSRLYPPWWSGPRLVLRCEPMISTAML